jgi:hypothetical protein
MDRGNAAVLRGPLRHLSARTNRAVHPGRLPQGGTILDPFFGAGTTGFVADRLQRNCIGIELNAQYAEIAERRLKKQAGMFADVIVAA